MKLSQNIQTLCKLRGWSLAKLARTAGMPPQTLHGWVTGRESVHLTHLRQVAQALEVSVYRLAFGEPDPYSEIGDEILKEIFSGDVRVTLHQIGKSSKTTS